MDRRRFLGWSGYIGMSVASPVILTACGGDSGADASPRAGTGFSLGVASGDPKPDSIILWTRVDGGAGDALQARVQLAADAAFTSILVDTEVTALEQWDYTLRHKVTGLSSNTDYYYRFITGSVTSAVGRTWTAPAADADVASLKFAFITCQDWNANHWGAFDALVNAEDPDIKFIVHVGDYIYERTSDGGDPRENVHGPITLPNGVTVGGEVYATTLDDYRALYKTYRSDPRLQALHARYPFIAIWDDHEFSDDCWGDASVYNDAGDSTTPTTGKLESPRRRSANQAWYEYMLADVTFDAGQTEGQYADIQIYRSFAFGKLATLIMTDERLYRADHIVSEVTTSGNKIGSRYLVPQPELQAIEALKTGGAGAVNAAVSMLGDTQRQWWKDQMSAANSQTTWKLWGNEVSLLRMQVDLVQGLQVGPQLVAGVVQAAPPLAAIQTPLAAAIAADLGVFGKKYILAKMQGTTLAISVGDLAQTQALLTQAAGAATASAIAGNLVSTLNAGYASFFQYFTGLGEQWNSEPI